MIVQKILGPSLLLTTAIVTCPAHESKSAPPLETLKYSNGKTQQCEYSHDLSQNKHLLVYACKHKTKPAIVVYSNSKPYSLKVYQINSNGYPNIVKDAKLYIDGSWKGRGRRGGAAEALFAPPRPNLKLEHQTIQNILDELTSYSWIYGETKTPENLFSNQTIAKFVPSNQYLEILELIRNRSVERQNQIRERFAANSLNVALKDGSSLQCHREASSSNSNSCNFFKCHSVDDGHSSILWLDGNSLNLKSPRSYGASAFVIGKDSDGSLKRFKVNKIKTPNQKLPFFDKTELKFSHYSIGSAPTLGMQAAAESEFKHLFGLNLPTNLDKYIPILFEEELFQHHTEWDRCAKPITNELTELQNFWANVQRQIDESPAVPVVFPPSDANSKNSLGGRSILLPLENIKAEYVEGDNNLWYSSESVKKQFSESFHKSQLNKHPTTPEQLNKLMEGLLSSGIDFKKIYSNCNIRAHVMAESARSLGLYAEKIWMRGKLRPRQTPQYQWNFHTAIAVAVRIKGKTSIVVVDPGLSSVPVSIQEWGELATYYKMSQPLRLVKHWPLPENYVYSLPVYGFTPDSVLYLTDPLEANRSFEESLVIALKKLEIDRDPFRQTVSELNL